MYHRILKKLNSTLTVKLKTKYSRSVFRQLSQFHIHIRFMYIETFVFINGKIMDVLILTSCFTITRQQTALKHPKYKHRRDKSAKQIHMERDYYYG